MAGVSALEVAIGSIDHQVGGTLVVLRHHARESRHSPLEGGTLMVHVVEVSSVHHIILHALSGAEGDRGSVVVEH